MSADSSGTPQLPPAGSTTTQQPHSTRHLLATSSDGSSSAAEDLEVSVDRGLLAGGQSVLAPVAADSDTQSHYDDEAVSERRPLLGHGTSNIAQETESERRRPWRKLWSYVSSSRYPNSAASHSSNSDSDSGCGVRFGVESNWFADVKAPCNWRWCRTVAIVVASLLVLMGLVWSVLVKVYIPLRLQQGSGEGSQQIHSLHLDLTPLFQTPTPDTLNLSLNATQIISEPPPHPYQVIMQPTTISIVTLGNTPTPPAPTLTFLSLFSVPFSWHNTYPEIPLLSFQFPGLISKSNITSIPLEFSSSVTLINTSYLLSFFKSMTLSPTTLRLQFKPRMIIPGIGDWCIPMWSYFEIPQLSFSLSSASSIPHVLNNDTASSPFANLFTNITVEEPEIDSIPSYDSNGTPVHVYNITTFISYNNTSPLTTSRLPSSRWGVWYHGIKMIDVSIYLDPVISGWNERGVAIWAKGDPDGVDTFMDWIGRYAEGENTIVYVKGESVGGVQVGGWLDGLVKGVEGDVGVPGANGDETREGMLMNLGSDGFGAFTRVVLDNLVRQIVMRG